MSQAEGYSNTFRTTINQLGGIASGDTSVTVTSAAGSPTTGQFRIMIDSELILVTAGQGTTTWTLSRGIEGTTAAAHVNGATVTQVLTRDSVLSVGSRLHLSDSYAALLSSSLNGRLFFPTDGTTLLRDNSSSWLPWGRLYPFTTPVDSSFSWVNQGTATTTATQGGIFLHAPATAGNNGRFRVLSAPATPYTVTAYIDAVAFAVSFSQFGLAFRDSVSGNIKALDQISSGGLLTLRVSYWTSATGELSAAGSVVINRAYNWVQFSDDGVNRIYRVSPDGQNWIQFYSETRTTDMTANQVGFFANAQYTGNPDIGVTLYSWKVT
jgi:hypothetical protein